MKVWYFPESRSGGNEHVESSAPCNPLRGHNNGTAHRNLLHRACCLKIKTDRPFHWLNEPHLMSTRKLRISYMQNGSPNMPTMSWEISQNTSRTINSGQLDPGSNTVLFWLWQFHYSVLAIFSTWKKAWEVSKVHKLQFFGFTWKFHSQEKHLSFDLLQIFASFY